MKTKLIRNLTISIYIAVVVLFVLVAIEFTLRILGYTYSTPHIMYDKNCYWRMAPRQKMHFRDERGKAVTFTINSLGARGGEFPLQKPPSEKRILCLGDSFTYGWGVDDSQTYPSHLQNLLDKDSHNFKVINFGCNGHNILHEVNFIKAYGLVLNSDYVIVQTSLNTDFSDIDELGYNLGYMPAPGYNLIKCCVRKTAIGNILLRYWNSKKVKDTIARRNQLKKQKAEKYTVKNGGPEPEKTKMPFDIYIDTLDELVKMSQGNNFYIIYVIMPVYGYGLDEFKIGAEYRKDIAMTAKEYYKFLQDRYRDKFTVIELFSNFNSKDLFLSDGHLNEKGNRLAARCIYEVIKNIEDNPYPKVESN